MSETASTHINPEELAATAHPIITRQQTDYFESKSEALRHMEAEGISIMQLGESEGGTSYTTLPRLYPTGLEKSLRTAFAALGDSEPQAFLHHDRYGITVGTTPEEAEEPNIELLVDDNERMCVVAIKSCRFTRRSLIPRQSAQAPPVIPQAGAIDLPLGRNILSGNSGGVDFDRALRDSKRDWERVLVVGEAAVHHYLELLAHDPENLPGAGLDRTDRIALHATFLGAANKVIGFDEPVSMAS